MFLYLKGIRKQRHQEIEKYEDTYSDNRKRRLKFYRHIKKMEKSRLTEQIYEFFCENQSKIKTDMMKWMFAVKEDIDAEGIRYDTNKH